MGLDSVVTLALGLGTGGTAERSLRPGPRPVGTYRPGVPTKTPHLTPGAKKSQGKPLILGDEEPYLV